MKLQGKKIEQLQSTEVQTDALTLPQANQTGILHRSCKALPLFNFIECYCNNDLTYLIISGEPTEAELQDAWNEILLEYLGLVKNEKSSYLFDLGKRITLLQYHIQHINDAVEILHYKYDSDIAGDLRGMGYKLSAEYNTEEYTKQLDMIVSKCKTRVFELGELQDEYKRLDDTVTGTKQTEEDFNLTIASLSKHQGYHINKKETTLLEFCSIFNLYLKEIAHLEKQAKHGRG